MANIETVYNSGLDALSNLFEVNFTLPAPVSEFFPSISSDELTFRIQDFSIPSSEANTYQVDWGPWTFDRPNSKVNQTRTTTMTIRIDKSYEVYQGFINWKNAIQNEYTGVVAPLTGYVTDISVIPITTQVGENQSYIASSVGGGVILEKCWPSSIGDISYSQSGADPLALSITWTFLRINRDVNVESVPSGPETSEDSQ